MLKVIILFFTGAVDKFNQFLVSLVNMQKVDKIDLSPLDTGVEFLVRETLHITANLMQ